MMFRHSRRMKAICKRCILQIKEVGLLKLSKILPYINEQIKNKK